MKENRGDRDQVINTVNGAQWKLCKPKGTNCRMLQCATPAKTHWNRGQQARNLLLISSPSSYSMLTGQNDDVYLSPLVFTYFGRFCWLSKETYSEFQIERILPSVDSFFLRIYQIVDSVTLDELLSLRQVYLFIIIVQAIYLFFAE